MSIEARLQELNVELPAPPPLGGVYKPVVIIGNLAFVSGHGPLKSDGHYITGRVGAELDLDAGYQAARQTGLSLLATLKDQLGSLDRVKRVVKSLGWVNCTDDFVQQPQVINGYSELMRDIFGDDAGVGARSAIGTNVLPGNIPVEIEIAVEIGD
ncbi:MAG: RidA family protein [Verrucomicrobiae bacterium]|nr:RidA family protein [Verrucomicrobiae bacterium]